MTKALAIAAKDLKQYVRNIPGLTFSLAAPLVLTAIIGFAMGGFRSGSAPRLQVTTVQVANLDQGLPTSPTNLGEQLVHTLQGPEFGDLMRVTLAADEASARSAVDRREAEAALIVPAGFTAAVMSPTGEPAQVVLYHDPTLFLRAPVVAGAVQRVLDLYSGSRVASLLTEAQMASRGAPADAVGAGASRAAEEYGRAAGAAPLLSIRVQSLSGPQLEGNAAMLGQVSAGMLVFFVFFAGGAAAETILREDEARTLPRLFTTPTARTTVLAGKLLSIFMIALAQACVLVVAAALLFGVRWGDPLGVAVEVFALAVAAAGLGLLVMSLAKDTRQAGYLLGGVLSILGLAGGLFTVGFENLPRIFDTLALFTPHGWAMRGWKLLLRG
ncbi:MAG: ABC transporter permease, partial [Anaerolineae bacterium]|nr:ABC transporter permease [Anaerolineae bacterium]